jgi:hypothetical protein
MVNSRIENLLIKTTDISSEWIDRIIVGVSNGWINKVSVYGFNWETEAEIELALKIDWDNQEFDFQGKDRDRPVDIDEAIIKFQMFNQQKGLHTEWRIESTPPENPGIKELGFGDTLPIVWATSDILSKAIVSGLSKLSIELNFGSDG